MDLAVIGFEIDARRAEAGAKRVNSALDMVEAKINKTMAEIQKLSKMLETALSLSGRGRGATSHIANETRRFLDQLRQIERYADTSARAVGNSFRTQFGSALDSMKSKAASVFASVKASASGLFSRIGGGEILSTVLGVAGGGIIGGAITSALGGVAGKLKDVIAEGIDFNATIESAQISLKRLLGSSAAAAAEIEKLKREALTAPVNFETLLELEQRLLAVGFSAKTAAKDLAQAATGVGLIAGTKGLDERLSRIVNQLTQAANKGRFLGEELSVLAENGVPALKILADATGRSTDEISRFAESGQLRGLETAQLLMKELAAAAKLAGPEVRTTFAVLSSNLGDLYQQTAGNATQNIFGSLKKGLESLTGSGAQGVAQSLSTRINDLSGLFTQDINKLIDSLQTGTFFDAAKQVGGAVTEGLKAGIVAQSDSLDKAVYNQAVNVLKVVKDALGIQSPSKKMRELGQFAGDGFTEGLIDRTTEGFKRWRKVIEQEVGKSNFEGFIKRLEQVAGRVGANPNELANVLAFESRFNAQARNPRGTATGLIQFTQATARNLGTSVDALAQQNAIQQLDFVEKYLRQFKQVLDTQEKVYTAVVAGRVVGDPESVLFRDRGRRSNKDAYFANRELDRDRSGTITAAEAAFQARKQGFTVGGVDVRKVATLTNEAQRLNRLLIDTVPAVSEIRAQAAVIPLNFERISATLNPLPSVLGHVASEMVSVTAATNKAAEQAANFRSIWKDPLEGDIKKLRDAIAQIGQNLDSKAQLEQLKAIHDLRQAEEDAILSQIRNRALLAEKAIFHAGRANARVLDFLQQETKGLTEIVGDAQINTIRTLFDSIDAGVDRLTQRLGVAGQAVNQLIKDLARLGAVKAFEKIFGAGAGSSSAIGLPGFGQSTASGNTLGNLVNFRTPNFNGNAGGAGQASGVGGFNVGGIGRLLGRIPGLGRLLGPRITGDFAGTASAATGGRNLPFADTSYLKPGIGAAPSALSSLGAGGLLAGGGILGSLLGGQSQAGRLIGGAGGALGLGALGGLGLFGGGIKAALPAFFSNPATAIVAGGILGGLALFKLFGSGGEFGKFRKLVDETYRVKVKGDKEGKGLFEQSKQIGELAFGRGAFNKRMDEVIRIEQVKQLIAAYGEQTNQQSELVKRTIAQREIVDLGNQANNFVRRAFGGRVGAGKPVIVGDGGRSEVYVPGSNGYVFPSLQAYERQMIQALQRSQVLNGLFSGGQRAAAQLQDRAPAQQQAPQQDGKQFELLARAVQALGYQQRELAEQMARIDRIPDDSLVGRMKPRDVARSAAEGAASDQTVRRSFRESLAS